MSTSRQRRRSRRTRHQPALVAAGLVLAVILGLAVLRALGWLLMPLALGGTIAYAYTRARRPGATRPVPSGQLAAIAADRDQLGQLARDQAAQLARLGAERDQLKARGADLARQLERQAAEHAAERAELTDAMHAAWDAAANAAPARPRQVAERGDDPQRAAMLGDRFSGVRPLGPR